jgi:hypothetical protein
MNTAIRSIRLTAAASAAILAVTFAGCANADTAGEPDTRSSIIDAGQGAVRFVPSDNDPRGRHVVRESLTAPAMHPLLVREYADRYVDELIERGRAWGRQPASGVGDDLSPSTGQ